MAQAHVDPEELEDVIGLLNDFSTSMREKINLLNQKLHSMGGGSWSDSRQAAYMETFEQLYTQTTLACDMIDDEHLPHLNDLKFKAEEYL